MSNIIGKTVDSEYDCKEVYKIYFDYYKKKGDSSPSTTTIAYISCDKKDAEITYDKIVAKPKWYVSEDIEHEEVCVSLQDDKEIFREEKIYD